MKLIKVAAGALNQTPRDWKNNFDNIIDIINQAKKNNVTILCLPEMVIPSWGLEDDYFCIDVSNRSLLKLKEILPYTKDLIVTLGLPIIFNNSLYNSIAMVINGNVIGFYCKESLASDGIHYESRYFKKWDKGIVQTINIPIFNREFPIGDIHFNIGNVKLGIELCEEAWGVDRHGNSLASKGCSIILNPSASHFSFGKINIRKNIVMEGSRAFNCTYIYSNLLGNESGRTIYDGCCLIASNGNLLSFGKRFSHKNTLLTTAVVNIDVNITSQIKTASFQPNIGKYNEGCINVPF